MYENAVFQPALHSCMPDCYDYSERPSLMAKYEIWGRKEWGKGNRKKIAYDIPTHDEAKSLRKVLIEGGYKDCIICQPQKTHVVGLEIERNRRKSLQRRS